MRIEAKAGATYGWLVWHVERCEVVPRVVWVDDQTNEFCQLRHPIQVVNGQLVSDVHRARRIDIHLTEKLVLVNPVDLSDCNLVDAGESTPANEGENHGAH